MTRARDIADRNVDSTTIDGVDSTQLLRSDVADTKTAGDLSFADSVKAQFGAGNDLQLYHDSNNSYIKDAGTGNLYINATELRLGNADNSKDYLLANDAGAVTITHNGISRLATTSTGINVTGDIATATGNYDVEFNASNSAHENRLKWNYGGNLQSWIEREHSDGSMVFGNQGSERMRITSAGAVNLTGFANGQINFASGNTDNGAKIQTFNDAGTGDGYLAFEGYTKEYGRFTSDGKLGLGTSSPDYALEVERTSGNAQLSLKSQNTGYSEIYLGDTDAVNAGAISYVHSNNSMKLYTNATERLRIDSSGNLLVGKTSTASNVVGAFMLNSGLIRSDVDGGVANVMNRKTSDGDIAIFQKDGGNVGSIGIQSTGFYIDGEGGHAGIRFAGNELSPRDNGADADGVVSLGESDKRWKDLYLSGGVIAGSSTSKNNSGASNFATASGDIQVTLERTATSAGWGGIGGNSANALHIYNSSTQKVFEVLQGGKVAYRSEGSSAIRSLTDMRQGASKAWTNFQGTGTVATRDSYNQTSIVDLGTGDYRFTINNDMANDDYSTVCSGMRSNDTESTIVGTRTISQYLAGSVRLDCKSDNGSGEDAKVVCVSIFGDLE